MTGDQKIDIINTAFSKLRISGLTSKPSSDEIETALYRLENMMVEFIGRGVDVSYNFEDEPLPSTLHEMDRKYWNPISNCLAFNLMADFGKGLSENPALLQNYKASNSFLVSSTTTIPEMTSPPTMPRGSGNYYSTWFKFY